MLSFEYKLNRVEISDKTMPEYIRAFDGDYALLEKGIKQFNSEINWDDMWNVEQAKRRISDGWKLIVLILENEINGWIWLDVESSFTHNLYVSKIYRGNGYGVELKNYISYLAQKLGLVRLECRVDEWNINSIKIQQKAGWVQKDEEI